MYFILQLKECIYKMKKTIYYFLAIVIGNILFLKFYFTQDIFKTLAFAGILAVAYAIPKFSTSLSCLFMQRDFSEREMNAKDPIEIKKLNRLTWITAVVLILLVGFHAWGYWNYMKYQNEDLSHKGIYTPAIVTDKKLETKSKHINGYYIYYTYRYNGLYYKHNCLNDTLEVGDTIVIKFSPNNPDHHIIMDKKF